jgi:protein subunit release factor A
MSGRKDFKIDVYRSRHEGSGASDWAVRVTHISSGITATRQGEGSDAADREAAVESTIKEIEDMLGR